MFGKNVRPFASVVGLAACCAMLAGCGSDPPKVSAEAPRLAEVGVMKDVTRVFMHARDDFSVLVPAADGKGHKLRLVRCMNSHNCAVFVYDAPKDGPMFVTADFYYGVDQGDFKHQPENLWYYCTKVVFHLHEEDDIEGGGWERSERSGGRNHTVTGTTHVVQ